MAGEFEKQMVGQSVRLGRIFSALMFANSAGIGAAIVLSVSARTALAAGIATLVPVFLGTVSYLKTVNRPRFHGGHQRLKRKNPLRSPIRDYLSNAIMRGITLGVPVALALAGPSTGWWSTTTQAALLASIIAAPFFVITHLMMPSLLENILIDIEQAQPVIPQTQPLSETETTHEVPPHTWLLETCRELLDDAGLAQDLDDAAIERILNQRPAVGYPSVKTLIMWLLDVPDSDPKTAADLREGILAIIRKYDPSGGGGTDTSQKSFNDPTLALPPRVERSRVPPNPLRGAMKRFKQGF